MGAERRSMIISDEEKKVTAIHEAGHAMLTVRLPHADPIHKVTIIPRGMALGVTQQLPVDEKHNYSRDYLNDRIAILLGGRIAEEIMLGQITTGAGNDLERATEMARKMVCEWGMSDAHGPAHLRQEGRADLPRPRDRAALGLQRGHGAPDRPGGQAHRHRELPARARTSCRNTASACRSWPTRCSRARCSTATRSSASSRACRSTTTAPPVTPEPPRAVTDDRTRKESRPGFVPQPRTIRCRSRIDVRVRGFDSGRSVGSSGVRHSPTHTRHLTPGTRLNPTAPGFTPIDLRRVRARPAALRCPLPGERRSTWAHGPR